ncbi:MAG: SDR family oxidoreductase [Gammaproteobacteria bacterium]|nr:MAG: SDR family oxidoreductase [Gammaproteobacteria bacterium]
MRKKILITGASSGFGKLITETLLKEGHTVIATMRELQSKNKDIAEQLRKKGAICLEMDVTSDISVNRCIQDALGNAGEIEVVVNNAATFSFGIQEAFTVEDWHRVFDVNLFDVQRVNRAVLPHMREKRSGLLIHLSSVIGRLVSPFSAPYATSKHALEALSDIYRIELASFGIESVLVEPGLFKTNIFNKTIHPSDAERTQSYGAIGQVSEQCLKGFLSLVEDPNTPNNPQTVADVIARIISLPAGKRPSRTLVDELGMASIIEPSNRISEEAQYNFYTNFGLADMLVFRTQSDSVQAVRMDPNPEPEAAEDQFTLKQPEKALTSLKIITKSQETIAKRVQDKAEIDVKMKKITDFMEKQQPASTSSASEVKTQESSNVIFFKY